MVKMKTNAALMTKDIMQGCYRSLISKHCDFSFVHFQIADNKRTTLIKSYSPMANQTTLLIGTA